ncbi:MAG TPA: hypothetical protein VKU02_22640, partial [Gemmataceae bacterium]|nr:hypothetical protein [Gemmataceae bacterium]
RINGNVELSGTANLGAGNNGSIKLGGGSAYTTNYYYDDVAIAANGYPGGNAPPPGGAATVLLISQPQAVVSNGTVGTVQTSATGSTLSAAIPVLLPKQSLFQQASVQDPLTSWQPVVNAEMAAVDSFFANWENGLGNHRGF